MIEVVGLSRIDFNCLLVFAQRVLVVLHVVVGVCFIEVVDGFISINLNCLIEVRQGTFKIIDAVVGGPATIVDVAGPLHGEGLGIQLQGPLELALFPELLGLGIDGLDLLPLVDGILLDPLVDVCDHLGELALPQLDFGEELFLVGVVVAGLEYIDAAVHISPRQPLRILLLDEFDHLLDVWLEGHALPQPQHTLREVFHDLFDLADQDVRLLCNR